MISSRQLEYFRAVARELHFTRAAETLRVAQPALSQYIRKLERQLGLELFERDHHRVRLTAAGTALLEHAERILSDLTAVEDEMLGWADGVRGRIRLGAAQGLATWLARLLADFSRAHPGVEVELREHNTTEMTAELLAGRLDAATLVTLPGLPDTRLTSHRLGVEPLVLIVGPDSPFPSGRRLPLVELDGADLVLYAEGSAVREIIVAALAEAGAAPRIRFETRGYSTARALAVAGLAAAIVPLSIAAEPGHPVRIVELAPEPVWTSVLAWSAVRRPAPALAAFLDFIISRTSDHQTDDALDI